MNIPQDQSYPIVLAVNPSHSTRQEHMFWNQVSRALDSSGWKLFQFAARDIPGDEYGYKAVVPARLSDFARKSKSLYPKGQRTIPRWITSEDVDLLIDWEIRRWELTSPNRTELGQGLLRLANLIDSTLVTVKPGCVLTTNKIDHPCFLFRKAAQHYGIYTGLVERSPMDSIWVEDDGLFFESSIWSQASHILDSDRDRFTSVGVREIQELRDNVAGFRDSEASGFEPREVFENSARPLFLLLLDNVLWTGWEQKHHPQRLIDYPIYESPKDAILHVSSVVRDMGGTLIVKKHPSCKYSMDWLTDDVATLTDGALDYLISNSDAVITFNTKTAFNVLAFEVPAVTLAPNPVAALGSTYHCIDVNDVGDTLRQAINRNGFEHKLETFNILCGFLAEEYFYSWTQSSSNEHRGPDTYANDLISRPEVGSTTHRYQAARPAISNVQLLTEGDRRATYHFGTSEVAEAVGKSTEVQQRAKPVLNVLFDGNRLFDHSLWNTGIARICRNIFESLRDNENINIEVLVTNSSQFDTATVESNTRKLEDFLGSGFLSDPARRRAEINVQRGPNPPTWDVFHSPLGPFPKESLTAPARRIITINDVLHLTRPDLAPVPGKVPAIRHILDSVNPTRDFVICISEQTKRDMQQLLDIPDEKVLVIPLAPEPPFLTPSPDLTHRIMAQHGLQKDNYIVILYQAEKRKNMDKAFEAIGNLSKNGRLRDTKIVVVNSRLQYNSQIQVLLKASGIQAGTCEIVEAPDDSALAALYSGAAGFLFPSLYEGFGLPPLEAMAAGCPVITSAVTSLLEATAGHVIYFDPENIDSIMNSIEILLHSGQLRDNLRVRGRNFASNFSWSRTGDQILDFYLYVKHFRN